MKSIITKCFKHGFNAFAALFIMVIIIGAAYAGLSQLISPHETQAAGGLNTIIDRYNVSTGVLVNTTSTLLLATSTARQHAYIVNMSPSAEIFLNLGGGTPATLNSGIRLAPGGVYEISDANLYTGAVYAIASSTVASTTVTAKQSN